MLLALVISPLTTHPFQDGAPFLLLTETPPTFGRSLCLFHILHRNCLLILSPSCFAVCGHHLSPRIAIVFSVLSSLPSSSMFRTSSFLSPPLTHPVPPCVFHILLLCESSSPFLCHTGTYFVATSSSRLLIYLFLFSGRSRSPTRDRNFSFLA